MPSFLSSIFGSKPTVPNLPSLDLQTEQAKAIAANQANLPASEQLASGANLFNQQQIDQMLQNAIPGFKGISSNIAQNISDESKGLIPKDVSDTLQSSIAAKTLWGGTSGTGAGGAMLAKELGLTSLQMTNNALSSAESWSKSMASMYEPGMMNLTSMFVSPSQQASFDTQERNSQFQRQWMQNQISAMPDPTTVGIWNTAWSVVDAALSAYTGSSVDLGRVNPQGSAGSTSGMNLGSGSYGYSAGAGEGGASFNPGAGNDPGGEAGMF